MSRTVYACRFDVPAISSWSSIVAPAYRSWISARYDKWHGITVDPTFTGPLEPLELPKDHYLSFVHHEGVGASVGQLVWQLPGKDGFLWRNEVRFGDLADRCIVEHQIILLSGEYMVAPAVFDLGAPTVIRRLCSDHTVMVGEMQIKGAHYPLELSGVSTFLDLLASTKRKLPVVLLTPQTSGEANLVSPSGLSEKLAGVAVVVSAKEPGVTWELSERIGRLGCYDGGIRIYWPGFAPTDPVHRHPIFFGQRTQLLGAERTVRKIERIVFGVAAFRFAPDPRIDQVVLAAESSERTKRTEAARADSGITWEDYALQLAEELDKTKSDLTDARAEIGNLRDNQRFLFTSDDVEDLGDETTPPIERNPRSVTEALDFASVDFPYLLILPSAREAAERSPFKRPAEIYEDLAKMNGVAEVWSRAQGAGDLRQMLIDSGLGRRVSSFVSKTAQGKYGDEYKFMYNGKRQLFESHITLGAGSADTCASIHYLPDAAIGKLVVAHCGRHLTNTRK